MVSFDLGKELRKMFFHLVTSVGQRKNYESPCGIESQTFGFAFRCSTTEPQRLFIVDLAHRKVSVAQW